MALIFESTNESSLINPENQSKTTIIRLVNGDNTSRPFLRMMDQQHIFLNNFDDLIRPNPFQRHSPAPKSPSTSPTFSPNSLESSGLSHSCFVESSRKSSVESLNLNGILKETSRSRFSRGTRKSNTVADSRRVRIVLD